MDSDEEEMAALRGSAKHVSRKPKAGPTVHGKEQAEDVVETSGADVDEDDFHRARMKSSAHKVTKVVGSGSERKGGRGVAVAGAPAAQVRPKIGPQFCPAESADADEPGPGSVEESDSAMKFFPSSFGRKPKQQLIGNEVHDTTRRLTAPLPAGAPASMDCDDDAEPDFNELPFTHEVRIPAHDKGVTAIGIDPKGSRMVTGGMDGAINFFDFSGMSQATESFRRLEPVEGHMVQAVSFSTSGGCLLVVCSDAHCRIYDRDGSSKPLQMSVKGDMYVRDTQHTNGHTQMMTDGVWHPFQSEHWLTSSLDGTLRIWDINARPVGMDQRLPCLHVLKTVDARNVCVGGGSGRAGGLHPCCCTMAPADGKMIAAGCSDGSLQFFFEKARYQRPDRILRKAHSEAVCSVNFVPHGGRNDFLASRSLDGSLKLWDCRMLSGERGPVRSIADLPCLEKTSVRSSPDGLYLITATGELGKRTSSSVAVFDTKTLEQKEKLDFTGRTAVSLAWPRELNQVIVGTSVGEVDMLYSPHSSKKGALHFVGKRRSKKPDEPGESGPVPIFNMTDKDDIKRFYSSNGNMPQIRRQEARQSQKTLVPIRPPTADGSDGGRSAGSVFVASVLSKDRKRDEDTDDIQQKLLSREEGAVSNRRYKDAVFINNAYKDNQQVLDYSTPQAEGDKRMQEAAKGDFCRMCGGKICRCVDYTKWGQGKKPRLT